MKKNPDLDISDWAASDKNFENISGSKEPGSNPVKTPKEIMIKSVILAAGCFIKMFSPKPLSP